MCRAALRVLCATHTRVALPHALEDWRQIDALIGERIAAVKKASGKDVKKLSDSFSEKIGITSTALLSTKAKIDIAATVKTMGVVSGLVGIPANLF